jgi:hypothetical protein
MLAIISAVALGIAAGGLIGALVTGDPLYTIAWSVAFAVGSLAGVFAAIGGFTRGLRDAASDERLQTGELALARVEGIRRTGLTVNDQPQCELTLTVAPRHRAAYTTTHRQIVDIVALAQLQPGSVIVVRRPDDAHANVVLQLSPPEDWARLRDAERLRTGTDRTVPLASDAAPWASEPRTLGGAPKPPARPWRRVVFAGAFLAAGVLVLVPAYDSIARTAQAFASGDHSATSLVLGDRHDEIVDALEAETGSSQFVEIVFYDTYALAQAPSAPGALSIDRYQFRYDRTERQGPALIQPKDPAGALFDANDVDFSRIPEYIALATEHTGIADPTSVIVIVERALIADAAGARPIGVMVLLDSSYQDATVVIDPATGAVVR